MLDFKTTPLDKLLHEQYNRLVCWHI